MSDVARAEQLWTRAHEHVKRGEFAQAVRDLSESFQLLQAANDPRLYEVHRRWTEVHQMYVEDGAREQPRSQTEANPGIEAEAEAAANSGDLERAISLYEQIVSARPDHDLARERLQELLQARARAHDLATGRSVVPAAAATVGSEDDWSDIAIDDSNPGAASPVPATAAADPAQAAIAPAMKPDDAPVGMQSLDVPFSVGTVISTDAAETLPVQGAGTQIPGNAARASDAAPVDDVAFLRALLERVQKNRRAAA